MKEEIKPTQKRAQSEDPSYWNNVYESFRGNRLSVWDYKPNKYLEEELNFFKEKGVRTVLDAGCGDGRNLVLLAQHFEKVIGVDYSTEALKRALRNTSRYENVRLIDSGLENLTEKLRKEVSLIVCDHTLVHIPSLEQVIENFYQVLSYNGYAFLEFTSVKERNFPSYRSATDIGDKEVEMNGVYFRFFDEKDIRNLLSGKFRILRMREEEFTQPHHSSGYVKPKKHKHSSYFVIARKIEPER